MKNKRNSRQLKVRKFMNTIGDAMIGIGFMICLIVGSVDMEMTTDMTPVIIGVTISVSLMALGLGINRLFPLPEKYRNY